LKLIYESIVTKIGNYEFIFVFFCIVTLHAIKLKSYSLKCFDLVFLSFKGNVARIVTSSFSIVKQMHAQYILTCKGVKHFVYYKNLWTL